MLISIPEDLHKDSHSEKANNFLTESSSKTQLINCRAEKTCRENIVLSETILYFKMCHKNKEKQLL